jgi:UDP-glucose 4-epimerase
MKKTIVIGGSGFIGTYLTKLLISSGREVCVVGRKENAPRTLPKGCHYIAANYRDRKVLQNILSVGCEIIDLAYSTVPKTSFEDPLYDMTSNLPSAVAMMEEAGKMGACKVLLLSSGGTVYGPAQSIPITENHPTCPISPYGITKLTVDRYAMMFHRINGLPVVVVRPGNAYGEFQGIGKGQGFLAEAIHAILSGRDVEIYGQEGTIRDYIHVSDVALGVMAALDKGPEGKIYNLGTGVGTSNFEVISILREFTERDGFAVRTRILPARNYDVEANVLDSSQLRSDTGWCPKIGLREGIQQVWNVAKGRKLSKS